MTLKVSVDCRHFKSDRPCNYHKTIGIHCSGCIYYDPIKSKILIIKLDAIGDVLRTTCILQGLKENYASCHITWLTMSDSIDLFKNNVYVDTVLDYSAESILRIQLEEYDLVINLDASPKSARLAEVAKGKEKLGFGYDRRGYVYPYNEEAKRWFEMGVFDDIKKANKETYQSIVLNICRLKPRNYDVILNLSDYDKEFGRRFAEKFPLNKPVIGLNTGAGGRWIKKKWTLEGYLKLIELLRNDLSPSICLFGGPMEAERNQFIMENCSNCVIDTGTNNTLIEFASLMNLCDLVVTGDTLALHVAVGLKKKVVALFGPTSLHEIDLYGRGEKISSDMECQCCYKQDCDKKPDCMEFVKPEIVMKSIRTLLKSSNAV